MGMTGGYLITTKGKSQAVYLILGSDYVSVTQKY